MPAFTYKAINARGETIRGSMDGGDAQSVASRLQAQGSTPVLVSEQNPSSVAGLLNMEVASFPGVSKRAVLEITQSLATLLKANIALDRALSMVRDAQAEEKRHKLLDDILRAVRSGSDLAAALDEHPDVFSPFYRNMVRAGEAGANIGAVLTRLATHMDKSQKARQALSSALIYPAFLIVAAIAAVSIMLTIVVPTFEPMFKDAGAKLPTSTSIVIAVGGFFQAYWWAMGLAVLGAGLAFKAFIASPDGRFKWHRFAVKTPLLGTVWLKSSIAQFARTLGVLLENGVSLPSALDLARDVSGNAYVSDMIAKAARQVDLGSSLVSPLRASEAFPTLALQLIEVGEETGDLPTMLHQLADIYENETKLLMDRFLAVLVPVLTLVIGLLIAFIVSSILFALFSINELAR